MPQCIRDECEDPSLDARDEKIFFRLHRDQRVLDRANHIVKERKTKYASLVIDCRRLLLLLPLLLVKDISFDEFRNDHGALANVGQYCKLESQEENGQHAPSHRIALLEGQGNQVLEKCRAVQKVNTLAQRLG